MFFLPFLLFVVFLTFLKAMAHPKCGFRLVSFCETSAACRPPGLKRKKRKKMKKREKKEKKSSTSTSGRGVTNFWGVGGGFK